MEGGEERSSQGRREDVNVSAGLYSEGVSLRTSLTCVRHRNVVRLSQFCLNMVIIVVRSGYITLLLPLTITLNMYELLGNAGRKSLSRISLCSEGFYGKLKVRAQQCVVRYSASNPFPSPDFL